MYPSQWSSSHLITMHASDALWLHINGSIIIIVYIYIYTYTDRCILASGHHLVSSRCMQVMHSGYIWMGPSSSSYVYRHR